MSTNCSEIIHLPFADHEMRRNSKKKTCRLELYKDHLEYYVTAEYESENKDLGMWEPISACELTIKARKDISELSIYYFQKRDSWAVQIDFHSSQTPLEWLYADKADAQIAFEKLKDYWLNSIVPTNGAIATEAK